ncbi:hypothetical protein [Phyllobacterium sp. CL33Tsu]|uniref:hypothetical protein n=1 Tax=Phyllobacterium sp. CL33Tsu TaxID=1798191 RepID=UPI001FCD43D8|nr:hypothetical protein [Phyllobacterium sp. CL33Tsu]
MHLPALLCTPQDQACPALQTIGRQFTRIDRIALANPSFRTDEGIELAGVAAMDGQAASLAFLDEKGLEPSRRLADGEIGVRTLRKRRMSLRRLAMVITFDHRKRRSSPWRYRNPGSVTGDDAERPY